MGLNFDPTKYGMKDYVGEFKAESEKQLAYTRGRLDALGINNVTVPISNSNKSTVDYETGWIRYTPRAFNSEQINKDINFDNNALQLKNQTVYTYRDGKKNNNAIDAAVNEVTQLFINYGTENGKKVDAKEAKKLAKRFVENELNKENFLSTRTFVDKAEYEKAQQDRELQKRGLVSKYMNEDANLSKKDAERKAEANLVRNQYLKNKGAREYINAHKEYFYDAEGNLSQEKYKAFTKGLMNAHTTNDEVDNYHLSLNERYDLAAKFGINDNSMCDMVHRAGGGFQKDYKELKQALIILLGAGAGAGVGALLNTAVSTAAGAAAGAGANGAGSNAIASAGARITVEGLELAGAAGGGLAAANIRPNSKGNDKQVYAPGKPEEETVVEEQQEQEQENPQVCELTPDEYHDVVDEEVNYCSYKIVKGDNWSKVAQTKYRVQTGTDTQGNPITRPVTPAEALKIAHELKMAHGIERKDFNKCIFPKVGEELRLYEEFDGLYHPELKGKKFIVDCDAETDGKLEKRPMKGTYKKWDGQYNGAVRERKIDQYWYEDCDNNRSNIFENAEDRNAAMRRKQEELNAAAGK